MSAQYRVFADAEGFFGEEGAGWGRKPSVIMTFEVENAQVGDLEEMQTISPVGKLDMKEAKRLLQSWL